MKTITVEALLTLLTEAGDAGLRGPEMADRFESPPASQRRKVRVNSTLADLRRRGLVRRAARMEASPVYNNTPTWRWWVTDAGVRYLAGGCRRGRTARLRLQREASADRRAEELDRRAAVLGDVAARIMESMDPDTLVESYYWLHKCTRDAEIRHLVAEGCYYDDVGKLFGLTRERVRQVAAGIRVHPCHRPGHDYEMTPCSHGVVRRPDPGTRRYPVREMRFSR